jgi:hypothetical protein
LGTFAFLFSVRIYATMADKTSVLPSYSVIGFYTLAGLLASLLSLIRLRVKDRATGNVLEVALVIGAVLIFFWITR